MTTRATRVSVPGKLILMGEHAAVYGRTALVTAIGLRMRVEMLRAERPGVEIVLPDLDTRAHASWAEIAERTRYARTAWRAFADSPSPSSYAALRTDRPQTLVMLALGESARFLAGGAASDTGSEGSSGWRVEISSEIPVGSGFGSSAAAAIGLVIGHLASRGCEHGWSVVDRIALEVERRQHGFPSGIDSATVYHGGVLQCRREEGELHTEPLPADPSTLRRVRVFDTGPPAESTGTIVADVRARRDRDPQAFERRLDAMAAATERMRRALVEPQSAGVGPLLEPIRSYQRCLEELGVVPRRVRRIVRAVEAAGGAAKISGAGSLTGEGAGSLLVVYAGTERLAALEDLTPLEAPLGVEGARLESVV